MERIWAKRNYIRIALFALAGVLLAVALWLGAAAWQAHAQAGSPGTGSAAPNAVDGGPFACTINNIAVFSGRIHVHCTTALPSTSISYFAASGDNAHAVTTNRFLMMLNTAYSLGRPVYLYYLNSSTSNIPGCNASDCRMIDWMFIVP
jgi:hypothetical protein